MITKNHNPYISDVNFKRIIREMLLESQEPCLEQTSTEVNLWYNHPVYPKRLCHRMGMFRTIQQASNFVDRLYEIMETQRKELGL